MIFKEWWKVFLKDNLTCINHQEDFKKAWNAAYNEGYQDAVKIENEIRKES
jgi:hypothetical protein